MIFDDKNMDEFRTNFRPVRALPLFARAFPWAAAPAILAAATLAGAGIGTAAAQTSPQSDPVVQPAPAPDGQLPPATPMPPRVYPKLSASQLEQLTDFLRTAPTDHGMPAVAVPALPDDARKSQEAQRPLVEAALDLALALHSGRLTPDQFEADWALRPAPFDPLPSFTNAVANNSLATWFQVLSPPYAGYDALKAGYATYKGIVANGGWPTVPAGPDLRSGATGARVLALRKRLAVEDSQVALSGGYDSALVDAVRRAQRRFGLAPTGAVGAQTLSALNVSAGERLKQIAANMERWRWMPREVPTNRVQVNIAAAVLTVFEGDQPVASMRAVTGAPDHQTPMLQSTIKSIVINPPWNVPDSIAKAEIWPKVRANPGYLKSHSFKVITNPDGSKRLQQAAGTSAALGRLKFDFPNPFAVYLHDTPTKSTFSTYSRLESHGCVRLEKPRELATLMLRNQANWSAPGQIDGAINKGKTERVMLDTPVAVYLLYWTAYGAGTAGMNFRDDPYKWDRALAAKIAAPRVQPPNALPVAVANR